MISILQTDSELIQYGEKQLIPDEIDNLLTENSDETTEIEKEEE